MSIVIAEESLKECLEELKPLLEEHYKEVALYQDKIDLAPEYDKYAALEDSGNLHTIVVRDSGKVIGYYISFIDTHIHYMNTLYAINDVIYLDPEYRHTSVSSDLLEYAEKSLKEIGVSVITLHMKTYLPFEGLAKKHGFDKVEYCYSKYIGK